MARLPRPIADANKISFAALSSEFAAAATTGNNFGKTSSGFFMIRSIKSSQSGQSRAAEIISASTVTGASTSRERATAETARRPISNALPSSPIHGP